MAESNCKKWQISLQALLKAKHVLLRQVWRNSGTSRNPKQILPNSFYSFISRLTFLLHSIKPFLHHTLSLHIYHQADNPTHTTIPRKDFNMAPARTFQEDPGYMILYHALTSILASTTEKPDYSTIASKTSLVSAAAA